MRMSTSPRTPEDCRLDQQAGIRARQSVGVNSVSVTNESLSRTSSDYQEADLRNYQGCRQLRFGRERKRTAAAILFLLALIPSTGCALLGRFAKNILIHETVRSLMNHSDAAQQGSEQAEHRATAHTEHALPPQSPETVCVSKTAVGDGEGVGIDHDDDGKGQDPVQRR